VFTRNLIRIITKNVSTIPIYIFSLLLSSLSFYVMVFFTLALIFKSGNPSGLFSWTKKTGKNILYPKWDSNLKKTICTWRGKNSRQRRTQIFEKIFLASSKHFSDENLISHYLIQRKLLNVIAAYCLYLLIVITSYSYHSLSVALNKNHRLLL
jgi:hypothetical protein